MDKSGKLIETLAYFTVKLKEVGDKYPNLFTEEVGLGLMRGLRAKDNETMKAVLSNCMEKRLIVLPAGKNTVRFLPSLTITADEIDEGFKRFEEAVSSI